MVYRKKSPLVVFLVPAFLFLTVFLFVPFLVNLATTFFKIDGLGSVADLSKWQWNDYGNYKYLIQEIFSNEKIGDMGVALKNTMILMVLTIVFQIGFALILAIMVDSIKWGAKIFRTVYFFPIVVSGTAIGMFFVMFYYMGSPYIQRDDAGQITSSMGALNQILAMINPNMTETVNFLDESRAFIMMCIPIIWQYVGYYFVIIVTGLNNISDDIYEAASIDGATGFKKVRYITLPLVYNTLTTCLTLAITGALKVFDLAWVQIPNGIYNTYLTGTYMYAKTFGSGLVGYGALIALVIVIIGVVISQFCNVVFKPKDY